MSYLGIKRRRDLLRRRWQFAAVGLTIFLGVMMFVTSYDAYRNLDASYRGMYERLAFADMTATGAGEGFAATVSGIDGVEVVTTRRQADVPLRVGGHAFVGRMVGMPGGRQPDVDKIDVTEGAYLPVGSDSVGVAEVHMADHFKLSPGDSIEYFDGTAWRPLRLTGVGVSPEYVWPARSSQEIFVSADSFGVLFVPEGLLDGVAGTSLQEQVLMRYKAGVDRAAVDAAVRAAAREAGAAAIVSQADQPSNKTLQLDVLGFRQMAIAFPVMFLLAAGMAAYTLMTRLVYQERHVIGTLRANGLSRAAVVRHYLSYGALLGVAAAILGVAAGVPLGWSTTYLYTKELGIPDTVRQLRLLTPLVGILFGLVAGVLSAWAPARAAARTDPAEAMRGFSPQRGGGRSLVERAFPPLARLPVRWRMVLRGIGRNRRRSLSTIVGVTMALLLILAAWGLIDTTKQLLSDQFDKIQTVDATVVFAETVTDGRLAGIRAVEGVDRVERSESLAVSVRSEGGGYSTRLSGFEAGTVMHGFPDGSFARDGVLLGSTLKSQLSLNEGDDVTLAFPDLHTQIVVPVAGFVDEPLGTFAYMRNDLLVGELEAADPPVSAARLESPDTSVALVRFANGADRAAVIGRLEALGAVASVSDERVLYDTAQQYMGLFWVFIGMMLVFGGLLAFALIFNIMSVNLAERAGELATMRANGLSRRHVAALVTGESLLLTFVAIPIGLVAGWWAARALLQSYSSDIFSMNLDVRWSTYVLSALAMVVVTLLSLWPGIRAAGRMDLGRVVRERSL